MNELTNGWTLVPGYEELRQDGEPLRMKQVALVVSPDQTTIWGVNRATKASGQAHPLTEVEAIALGEALLQQVRLTK